MLDCLGVPMRRPHWSRWKHLAVFRNPIEWYEEHAELPMHSYQEHVGVRNDRWLMWYMGKPLKWCMNMRQSNNVRMYIHKIELYAYCFGITWYYLFMLSIWWHTNSIHISFNISKIAPPSNICVHSAPIHLCEEWQSISISCFPGFWGP